MANTEQEMFDMKFDFESKLMQGIRCERNRFCDIKLWAEGNVIPAHKLILSIASPIFGGMIDDLTNGNDNNGSCASKILICN